jgi:hypothetical protein
MITLINTESQGNYFDTFSHCDYLKNNPDDSPLLIIENKQILNHMLTDSYDYPTEQELSEEEKNRAKFFKYAFRTCFILLIAFIISLFFSCAPVRTIPQTWVCVSVYQTTNGYVHKFVSLTRTQGYDELFDTVLFEKNDTMQCYWIGRKLNIKR